MLGVLTVEGKWFKACEFNEITFGDLTPSLKGHQLENVKVKSIFGVRGEYGNKASSMKLLRMGKEGYVQRRKKGRVFFYRLTRNGWDTAERLKVRVPFSRIPQSRFRKHNRVMVEQIDLIQEATDLILDQIKIVGLRKTISRVKGLIKEGEYSQAADYLTSWYLMDKFENLVHKKERQFERRRDRFKERVGKDLETFVKESGEKPKPIPRVKRVTSLLYGTEYIESI